MKASIKRIVLENFKGVKSATYEFKGKNVSIKGQNGAGKSTIFDAYMWVLSDKDGELKSNPSIRPLGIEECTPRAEIVFDVDGKEVTVEKFQKKKEKESEENGNKITKVSLENSYKVNHSPMGLAQFKKKMESYGFDFEKFLFLSHPDAFTNQMSAKKDMEKMRNTLFEMTSVKSDYEIACGIKGTQNVALLLDNYTVEEIRNIQNDALRKIRTEYGKDGEILRAKIEGMELSKEDIDTAELELQKNDLQRKLDENKAKQTDADKQFEELDKQTDGIMKLKFGLNGLEQEANKELSQKKKDLRAKIDEKREFLFEISDGIQKNKREIAGYENDIKKGEEECKRLLDRWKEVQAEQFDENTAICPTCHRELPEGERERLMSEFEKTKSERLAEIEKQGSEAKQGIKNAKEMVPKLKECNKDNETKEKKLENKIKEIERQLSELPERIDISDREDVAEINRQIAEKEQAMQKCTSTKEIRQQLQDERDELQEQMDEVNEKLALAKKNVEIDEEIEKERKKQDEYEQNRANAEKILDQLKEVNRKKNEMLTDEINRHFDIVKWKLFDFQKNGEYKDCCIPLIDCKRFGESTNTGREILAKLDIIKGLQRFYSQNYPVFLDGSECLSEETMSRIDMDCQIIYLSVPNLSGYEKIQMTQEQIREFEEYYKELRIEVDG